MKCANLKSHKFAICLTPQNGRTALYQASKNGHSSVVEVLTNAGAGFMDIQDEV